MLHRYKSCTDCQAIVTFERIEKKEGIYLATPQGVNASPGDLMDTQIEWEKWDFRLISRTYT